MLLHLIVDYPPVSAVSASIRHDGTADISSQGFDPLLPSDDDEPGGASMMIFEGVNLIQKHLLVDRKSGVKRQPPQHQGVPNISAPEMHNIHTAMFHSFLQTHQRTYNSDSPDYIWRHQLFMQRAAEVARHNSQENRMWTAGINKLADRSEDELKELLGWAGHASSAAATESVEGVTPLAPSFLQVGSISDVHSWGQLSPPKEWSWSQLNATRRVHNQGACGSCWAIASASVLQAHMEIHTPARARWLSTQELVSCVPNPHKCGGSGACGGATTELAMDYVMHYGLDQASELAPEVEGSEGQHRCPQKQPSLLEGATRAKLELSEPGVRFAPPSALPENRQIGIQAWERLPPNSYNDLIQAVVVRGPVAVAVSASKWFPYSHGIFNGCGPNAVIDHAVVLLGYGRDPKFSAKYWLVQNSWGPEWGEEGRIRLLRRRVDQNAYCGVDSQPQLGTGCDGGPKEVKVCGMCGILYDTVVPHF
jgi:cathepsin L